MGENAMTLAADAAANRAALIAQLYDDWRGHYIMRCIVDGAWIEVRPLDRAEALTYRLAADEALEIVWRRVGDSAPRKC